MSDDFPATLEELQQNLQDMELLGLDDMTLMPLIAGLQAEIQTAGLQGLEAGGGVQEGPGAP
jgi:hypothetical protein